MLKNSRIQQISEGSDLHLWRVDLPHSTTDSISSELLSSDEKERARRLLDPLRAARFTASRAALRQILSRYLSGPPEQISFLYQPHGKPELATSHSSSLSFNLSHSQQLAVIAVSFAGPVGIDLEWIDPQLDFLSLAGRYFNATEQQQLAAAAVDDQRRAFYRLWTAKEARLKLSGAGFAGAGGVVDAVCREVELEEGYVCQLAVGAGKG